MLPQEIIRRKRDGKPLSDEEIAFFIDGLTTGNVGEDQAAAFAMAVFFRGMRFDEAGALTRAMAQSGRTLDWSREALRGPVLDKHSTGGVGDNVSLVLAPLIAACGAHVPMIAGRGLGHTGGTLDKLDSIPGYRTQPDIDSFRKTVLETGCAIVGQTHDLAPADRRLYAIRDVTATVESIPLITASILAKKLAAGLQGLVMDVKTGSGAFMTAHADARALAHSLVETAHAAGLPTVALLTDMDAPLAPCAGNAIEVRHAIDHLAGRTRDDRFMDVTFALGVEMLLQGQLAVSDADARTKLGEALDSGRAAEIFARMCESLGGPRDIIERAADHLAQAPIVREIRATCSGVVRAIDTHALGIAVVALGGGRHRHGDLIDHAVGFTDLAKPGDTTDRPLAVVHARTEDAADRAEKALRDIYRIGDDPPAKRPAIFERITAGSLA